LLTSLCADFGEIVVAEREFDVKGVIGVGVKFGIVFASGSSIMEAINVGAAERLAEFIGANLFELSGEVAERDCEIGKRMSETERYERESINLCGESNCEARWVE
jgi:hypothetical protein